MTNMLDAALEWHAAGCSVIPIRVGGNKKPAVKWTSYMSQRADEAQITRWWTSNPDYGIGIVCGAISGGLEMLELEGRVVENSARMTALEESLIKYGVDETWKIISNAYSEWTPSGGLHLLYRTDGGWTAPGNTKIAIADNLECLSETRGEGGYVVVAPSGGQVHKSGEPWVRISGSPNSMCTIGIDVRVDILAAVVDALDERPYVPAPVVPDFPQAAPRLTSSGERPGDAWMRQTPWPQILCPQGWTIESQRGSQIMWTRPGKDRRDGCSASTGIRVGQQDCLWVWSSSAGLPTEEPLTKLFVLAHYDFNGSLSEAAKDLAAQGFGDKPKPDDLGWADVPHRELGPKVPGGSTEPVTAEEPESRFYLRAASTYPVKRVKWWWEERAPIGEITLIPGREGVGKSLLLARLGADITAGNLAGEFFGTPRNLIYVASEDSWTHTVVPRLLASGADMDRIFNICYQVGEPFSLPASIKEITPLLAKAEPAVLMLDPIISLVDNDIETHKAQSLRRALEPLRSMAEALSMGVVGLVHFNKSSGTDVSSKVAGSRAWMEVARAAIAVARLPEDEDEDDPDGPDTMLRTRENLVVLSQEKSNLGRLDLPNLTYKIISHEILAEDGLMTSVGKIVWGHNTETSVADALDHERKKKGSNVGSQVVDFIRRVSEGRGGPVAVVEIMTHFTAAPYSMANSSVYNALSKATEKNVLRRHSQGFYIPVTEED